MDTERFSDSTSTTNNTFEISKADWSADIKKRDLYMIKLVSLFLLRLAHDDNVEDFHLLNNVDYRINNNICFKVKIKDMERPVIVILYSKHYTGLFIACARSYTLEIMRGLTDRNDRLLEKNLKIFGGKIEDHDFLHVCYTNARVSAIGSKLKPHHGPFVQHLNRLIGTGSNNRQGVVHDFTDDELKQEHEVYLRHEMGRLADDFYNFFGDQSMHIMESEHIVQYHVLLARRVVNVSDIQTQGSIKYRELTFRRDLFFASDEYLIRLRNQLCKRMMDSLTSSTVDCEKSVDAQITGFSSHSSATSKIDSLNYSIIACEKMVEQQISKILSHISATPKKPSSTSSAIDCEKTLEEQISEVLLHPSATPNKDSLMSSIIECEEMLGKHISNILSHISPTPKKPSLTSFTIDCEKTLGEQISEFLSHPSATTLSPLIEKRIIVTGNHRLQFNVKRPSNDLQKLDLINSSTTERDIKTMIKEAEYITVKKILMSLKLKVPVTFGNRDLVLIGDSVEKNRRIDLLKQFLIDLCETWVVSGKYKIVTIRESKGMGFLSIEGGIGSAIGNLLVYDEATKLLKFTENFESLQENAYALYDKLKSSSIAGSLYSYRFDAKTVKHFPKLELDSIAEFKTHLNKYFVLYEQQCDQNEVANILKKEIERQFTDEQNVWFLTNKIFMYCLSAVQEWWMTMDFNRNKKRRPLTKTGDTQTT